MDKLIYLDYNATTPIDPQVFEVMLPYLKEEYGNPSSVHTLGKKAYKAVQTAREQTAAMIGCDAHEIIFTSGGSESNNLALKGIALESACKRNQILVSAIEHPSVLEPAAILNSMGYRVLKIPVDSKGCVDLEIFKKLINERTLLVSVMHANNEVGTIQPIQDISQIAHEYGALMHMDAAQSAGKIPVSVNDLEVDLLTLAGHKMYGPKGVGALFVKSSVSLKRQIDGAGQENGLRAGTENVAGIAAFGQACELIRAHLNEYAKTMRIARDALLGEFRTRSRRGFTILGDLDNGLPNTLSVSFEGIGSTDLMAYAPEVAMSPGAACHARDQAISHVLSAMGYGFVVAHGAVRFSTGRYSSVPEIRYAADKILEYTNRGR